jgi:hypothetical protein
MEKEIFEVPNIIENILGWRVDFQTKEIKSNSLDKLDIKNIEKLYTKNLIIFYEDFIDDNLKNKANKIYKKPINQEIIASL